MDKKSARSLVTATHLINAESGSYCNMSIHCSYYAVLQLMKYILDAHKDRRISYDEQRKKAESYSGGSHEFVLDEIGSRITCKPADWFTYKSKFRALKKCRVTADYEQYMFTLEESIDCRDMATGLISALRRYFNKAIS